MKIDIKSIYKKEGKKQPTLIHSDGLMAVDWEEKEKLEKLIEEIPIFYHDDFAFEAKVILENKKIEIYPNAREYDILPWYFKINKLDGLDDLVFCREGFAFNFSGNRFTIYYLSTIYQKKLQDFHKAIKNFTGF